MAFTAAAFTMVRDEATFLPIWLRHYGDALGRAHLFVIDDNSSDGSTDGLGEVNLIRLDPAPFDEERRAQTVSFMLEELLRFYDVVIFSDVDELLIVDPLLKLGLRNYLERHAGTHTNAIGLNLIHNRFEEPDYTPALGVLTQRRFASFDPAYCKQLIHREPVIWMPGFHLTSKPVSTGVGLYLFHLRALDHETSRRRVRRLSDRQWADASIRKQLSNHLRMDEADYLAQFYPQDPDLFRAALPERDFNGHIAKVAALRADGAGMETPELRALATPMLNVPARFLSAVAPVAAQDAAPNHGPCRVAGVTPSELYRRAAKRVVTSGIRYT